MSNQNFVLRTGSDKFPSIDLNLQNLTSEKIDSPKKPLVFQKSIIVFFASFATFIMFLLRFNLSVVIVAILDEKIDVPVLKNYSSLFDSTIGQEYQNSSSYIIESRNKYNWDEATQGQVLASYFYGYTLFQVPFGRLSEIIGAKWVIGLGTVLPGILTMITPLMVELGLIYVYTVRFLIGALHAGILCSSYTLVSCWMPKNEKASGLIWIAIFIELGGMMSFFLSGYISSNEYLGWKYSFYLLSITAFIWFIPFYFLVYSEPNFNPRLTKFEKNLLDQSRAVEISKDDFSKKVVKVPPKLNVKQILTSRPVWGVCISKFTSNFGFYLIKTKMPTYLKEVFQVSVSENGFLSSLPYLGSLASKIICLKLSDYIIKKKLMSLTNTRKFFQIISMIIPGLCIFLITVKNDDKNLAIILMVLAMFGQGFTCAGDGPMITDFAGDLSGTIFGFTNTFACIDGFFAPILVGVVMDSFDDVFYGWNIVFYVCSSMYLIGSIFFFIFASSKLQPWAVTKYEEVDIPNDKINIKTIS